MQGKEAHTLKIIHQSYALRIFGNSCFSSWPPLSMQDLKHTQLPAPPTPSPIEKNKQKLGWRNLRKCRKDHEQEEGREWSEKRDFLSPSAGTQYGLELSGRELIFTIFWTLNVVNPPRVPFDPPAGRPSNTKNIKWRTAHSCLPEVKGMTKRFHVARSYREIPLY